MTQSTVATQTKAFFDLHTAGTGVLTRVRKVSTKKDFYLAVDIISNGTRLDCNVSGARAAMIVELLQPLIDEGKTVVIAFNVGDLNPVLFSYTTGEKIGQEGISNKCRLLAIYAATVDGQLFPLPEQEGDDVRSIDTTAPVVTRGLGAFLWARKVGSDEREVIVAAIHGDIHDPERVLFGIRVSDPATVAIIDSLAEAKKLKQKVTVGFRVSGIRSEAFIPKKPNEDGTRQIIVRTTLDRLTWAKIDGKHVMLNPMDEPVLADTGQDSDYVPASNNDDEGISGVFIPVASEMSKIQKDGWDGIFSPSQR